jgi:hypothetical protein
MDTEGLLPRSQEPATGPYNEPNNTVHNLAPCLWKTHTYA